MRILSLEPYITELIIAYGLADSLVAVTDKCELPKELPHVHRVILSETQTGPEKYINKEISRHSLNLTAIRQANPDTVVASLYKKSSLEQISREDVLRLQANLSVNIGSDVKLISYAPRTLEEIYEGQKELSKQLKVPHKGIDSAGKIKAQIMNWADNFYDRIKNKKVAFISSIEPLTLAGFWIPDMIHAVSAHSENLAAAAEDKLITWEDVVAYKPDVIIVAPRNYTVKESMATFKILEKKPGWEDVPAVKRGEVVFADGSATFYYPGHNIIDSMAILISGLAGFESGYITPRDSFFKLRWLEMQRHKI